MPPAVTPKISWPKLSKLSAFFKTKKDLEQEIADPKEQTRQLLIIKAGLLRRLRQRPNPTDASAIADLEEHVARLQDIIVAGGRGPLIEFTVVSYGHEERAARMIEYQIHAAQIEELGQQLRREKALSQRLREKICRFREFGSGRRHSV